jgi:hypothetical protein
MPLNLKTVAERQLVAIPDDLAQRTVYENLTVPLFFVYRQIVAAGGQAIEGRTFRNCVIEGPAVLLAAGGVRFDGCDLGDAQGDIRNLLLRPVGPRKVVGAIAVRDTVFEQCRFFGVGFTGGPDFIDHLIQALGSPTA